MLACLCWLILFTPGCDNSTDRLIAQLCNDDVEARRAAARALADQRGHAAEVVSALSDAVQDPDLEVRELAIGALREMHGEAVDALPALEQALADPELSVRFSAALAMQKIDPGNEAYVPVLLESLRSGHGTVFIEVGRMGAEAEWAVPTLIELLSHQEATIRALAASTLGRIGTASGDAEQALERTTRDPEPAVRRAAESALEQIRGQPAEAGR